MRRTLAVAIASAVIMLAAADAWAVVVSFEATDASGAPLPGATIRIGDRSGTTGPDGTASIDVAAEPGDEVEVVVFHGGAVVFEGAVDVRQGAPVRVTTRAPSAAGSGVESIIFPDGFESGDTSAWSRLTVAGTYSAERVDPKLGAQTSEVLTRIGGSTVPGGSQSGSLTPNELADANASERKRHEIPSSLGLRLALPLPSFGGGRRPSLAPFAGTVFASAEQPSPAGVDTAGPGGAAPRAGGWRFYPSLSVGVSQADVEFRSQNLADGTQATFSGDGLRLIAGVQGVLFPCGDCRWFGTVSYEHARTGEIDVTRNPGLETVVPAGVEAVEDRVRYRARSDSFRATVGRAFRHVAPWAGVRGARFRGHLDVDLLIRAIGLPAEQSQSARNEYEESLLEAIAGVDVGIPGTKLMLRVEGSGNGDDFTFGARVGVAFGR
jgi:hypothetical protein